MNKGVKELKSELKKYFPEHKFSLKYDKYAGGSNIAVFVDPPFMYNNGESDDKKIDRVEAICKQYQAYKDTNAEDDSIIYATENERPKKCATYVTFHNFTKSVCI